MTITQLRAAIAEILKEQHDSNTNFFITLKDNKKALKTFDAKLSLFLAGSGYVHNIVKTREDTSEVYLMAEGIELYVCSIYSITTSVEKNQKDFNRYLISEEYCDDQTLDTLIAQEVELRQKLLSGNMFAKIKEILTPAELAALIDTYQKPEFALSRLRGL